MMSKKPVLLSVKQAAGIIGLSPCQVRVLIRKGIIKAELVGTEYVLRESALKKIRRRRQLNKEHE